MSNNFELPIYYIRNKKNIAINIKEDLEFFKINDKPDDKMNDTPDDKMNDTPDDKMNDTPDDKMNDTPDDRISLLSKIFNPTSKIGKNNLTKQFEYFTNNKSFLKQSQHIFAKMKTDDNLKNKIKKYDDFYDLWHNIRNDDKFADRYYYVDIDFFKFLNNNSLFLQILSLYNLLSPVLSLCIPIIMLILPFFMLKFSGVSITMTTYIEVLKNIFSKHALGHVKNIFENVSLEKKFYALISIGFYLFSIYQNSLVCYRFYQNFKQIHTDLFLLSDYLDTTISNMCDYSELIKPYSTYSKFLNILQANKEKMITLKNKLDKISKFNISGKKCNEIGYVMKYFYEIHINEEIKQIIDYSFGFNGYLENLQGLYVLYKNKTIKKCKFGKQLKFEKINNPYLLDKNPIQNDIVFDNNIIITGPNASGKTTILKSILFNILISQSYGCGFYLNATMPLYNNIHCYLNIPDTSGRDSLFQAEARRCKEIIDSFKQNEKHFCIFDELFSGTNPNEACCSSFGFINYMLHKQVDFILTTHLHELCYKLNDRIKNLKMEVIETENFTFNYVYKIKKGISSIKGGIKVLKDLNYPVEIIEDSISFRSNY
jgi:hypothetical protein